MKLAVQGNSKCSFIRTGQREDSDLTIYEYNAEEMILSGKEKLTG